MNNNILEVKELNISLQDDTSIVRNINFNVKTNRILGIIGESGSGKTMISKSIMRLLNTKKFHITGQVLFDGQDIYNISRKDMGKIRGRKLSLILQNPMTAFDPMSKIGSQLIETLRVHFNITKKEAYHKAIGTLRKMNIGREEEIMDNYPFTLSGGMLQRIMIALTIMLESRLIIADEVTTAIDAFNKTKILEEFKKLKGRGITMMVITHDFRVISALADDIIVLKKGEIIESGNTYDIFNNPKHGYTRKLIEATNLIETTNLIGELA
ncbi:ABC transporter ATP-binding protein [Vallitalea longa]|uniref:ABC transporter ATP-binding protein n=1 Tax=Vallitalea longa TaxID=2936439 RepID=A0A9W6DFK9_9FIRM|nr:ABC transporter ATP-binding protein [Vallitalea longa]GKX28819.1 ABC transporter ATP-binding protein [Vallitalea longa]